MTKIGRGGPCHRGKGGENTVLRGAVFNSEAPGDGPYPGDKGPGHVGGGSAYERLLSRYGGFFEELGFGAMATFKQLLEQVELAVSTAVSEDVNLLAKLYVLKSAKASIDVVADYYSRFLPPAVVNNLRADLSFLLERAKEVVIEFG